MAHKWFKWLSLLFRPIKFPPCEPDRSNRDCPHDCRPLTIYKGRVVFCGVPRFLYRTYSIQFGLRSAQTQLFSGGHLDTILHRSLCSPLVGRGPVTSRPPVSVRIDPGWIGIFGSWTGYCVLRAGGQAPLRGMIDGELLVRMCVSGRETLPLAVPPLSNSRV